MSAMREELEFLFAKIKQERDELKLKAHLGGMDAKESWEELEKKYEHARGQMKGVAEDAGDVTDEVKSTIGMLFDELKDGYRSIRARL